MYLSQLLLNLRDREARKMLRTPYTIHAAVMRGFPNDTPTQSSRILFRVEPPPKNGGLQVQVLVQTPAEPDWTPLAADFDKTFYFSVRRLPEAFSVGRRLRFRLRANPVVNHGGVPNEKRGKRYGVAGEDDQFVWLETRARKNGFVVSPAEVCINDEGFQRFHKRDGGHTIRIKTVLYEGRLSVTDSEAFSQALRNGVGPAKGFGCGMLSLAAG
jgi:CRISPR system Cascade subunit CasE